ncbi:MAG: hypothetical protein ACRC0Y_03975 [Fusobacteriaceae bacterium]
MCKINKQKGKYFYFIKDYCNHFNKEINEESVYEFVNYSISECINPFLFQSVSHILDVDFMYEKCDLVIDSFMVVSLENDLSTISIKTIKNSLRDIVDSVMSKKRRMIKGDQSAYYDATDSSVVDCDSKLLLNNLLDTLSKEDRELIEYHFIHGYSRTEIVALNIYSKGRSSFFNDINRILKKLKDTM